MGSLKTDSRTSEICAGLDGKVFDLKDAAAGSNLPPMHPFCRSTTLPVLPDEEELDRQIKEIGDEIGADVSFDEWQKNLVETEDGKLIYRVDKAGKSGIIKDKFTPVETDISRKLSANGVEYNEVKVRAETLADEAIVNLIAGGDRTTDGSCASVALAYVGQKQGWNVFDFRGGNSRDFFANKINKINMFKELGVKTIVSDTAKTSLTNGRRIFNQLQEGKEYYLSVGRHAAIVKKINGTPEYLELQSPDPAENGWHNFGDLGKTLKCRFKCTSSSRDYPYAYATEISQLSGDKFRTILGYVNTAENKQLKGSSGSVR